MTREPAGYGRAERERRGVVGAMTQNLEAIRYCPMELRGLVRHLRSGTLYIPIVRSTSVTFSKQQPIASPGGNWPVGQPRRDPAC